MLKCQSTNTNATIADVYLKNSLCHPIVEMNTSVQHAVMGIRADSCPLFRAHHPLALRTFPLRAAHPPAGSREPNLLGRVPCKANESL